MGRTALISAGAVHQVLHLFTPGVAGEILTEHGDIDVPGLAQRHIAGDVRGEDQVFSGPQGMLLGQGLRVHHIQRRTA